MKRGLMVHQATTLPDSRANTRVVRRSGPAQPVSPAEEPALTAPRLLCLIIICLLIPGNFALAGTQMSPNRAILLVLFPILVWRWLRGVAGGPSVVDVLMLLSTGWLGLALTVNHGLSSLPRSVILCVEIFGGYLVGRMLIRNTSDYRRFFVLMTIGFACLLPFALVEMVTGKNILRMMFDHVLNIPPRQSNLGKRLGLTRAQAVFDHPILFGLVASMGVANGLYIWRDKFVRSLQVGGFFAFMVFTTISSGPMLSVLLQLAMTGWDRMSFFLRGKWFWLAGGAGLVLLVLTFAAQFHILDFVIQNLMFNPQTADGRLIILEYGSAEVFRHPIFGIGLNDWVRPWYKAPTFDNFWLNYAMRFGLPSFALLAAAIGIGCSRIAMQSTLTRRERDYRTGYLITFAGLTVTLGTVYIWASAAVFVWIYIGAGAWLYMRETTQDTTEAAARIQARRAAQASGFGSEPVVRGASIAPPRASTTRRASGSRVRATSAATLTVNEEIVSGETGRPGDDRHV